MHVPSARYLADGTTEGKQANPFDQESKLNIQLKRFSDIESSDIVCNADMHNGELRQLCKLQEESQSLMRAAMSQLNSSARAYHRILQRARTIADLAGCEESRSMHLAEALEYRPKLMMG